MNPWNIFAAALATILVMSFFFMCVALLIGAIESWQDWKLEQRERLLKLEHRETEL